MKVIKSISLEHNVAELLNQENNASLLVNTLLTEYFNSNLRFKEIEDISELIEKKREIARKIKDFNEKSVENMQKKAHLTLTMRVNPQKLAEKWRKNEVSDAEYWQCFDKNGKFIIEKAKELIERGQNKT